jgi:transposase
MFEIPAVKFVFLYSEPINTHWGEKKLSELCREKMGIEPKEGHVFIFFNRKKDQMKLFFYDETGSQELLKVLPQGGFLIPAAKEGESYIKMSRQKLNSLFRTTILV